MKKVLKFLAASAILLSLSACGSEQHTDNQSTANSHSTSQSSPKTANQIKKDNGDITSCLLGNWYHFSGRIATYSTITKKGTNLEIVSYNGLAKEDKIIKITSVTHNKIYAIGLDENGKEINDAKGIFVLSDDKQSFTTYDATDVKEDGGMVFEKTDNSLQQFRDDMNLPIQLRGTWSATFDTNTSTINIIVNDNDVTITPNPELDLTLTDAKKNKIYADITNDVHADKVVFEFSNPNTMNYTTYKDGKVVGTINCKKISSN